MLKSRHIMKTHIFDAHMYFYGTCVRCRFVLCFRVNNDFMKTKHVECQFCVSLNRKLFVLKERQVFR